MLILSRSENETLVLDVPPSTEPTRIVVLVAGVRRGAKRVQLGVEADKSVVIYRGEVTPKEDL